LPLLTSGEIPYDLL
jgi:hypothetical protein